MKGMMIDLGEVMAGAAGRSRPTNDEPPKCTLMPEAQISQLQELVDSFQKGCTYRVGDLITPRACMGLVGAGTPHMVIEILPEEERIRSTSLEPSANNYMSKPDIRVVAYVDNDHVVNWVADSWMYEPYVQK